MNSVIERIVVSLSCVIIFLVSERLRDHPWFEMSEADNSDVMMQYQYHSVTFINMDSECERHNFKLQYFKSIFV